MSQPTEKTFLAVIHMRRKWEKPAYWKQQFM